MADFVPLREFAEAVRAAVENGRSGAFFITSPDQHSAMLTLDRGRITGVKYRNQRGYEAAQRIAAFPEVRFQTSVDLTELPGQPSLDTRAVVAILAGGGAAPADAGATGEPAARATDIDPGRLDTLRTRYIRAIGPIGGTIFDEEWAELGTTAPDARALSNLIERLADQIDDDTERERFRADALNEVNSGSKA